MTRPTAKAGDSRGSPPHARGCLSKGFSRMFAREHQAVIWKIFRQRLYFASKCVYRRNGLSPQGPTNTAPPAPSTFPTGATPHLSRGARNGARPPEKGLAIAIGVSAVDRRRVRVTLRWVGVQTSRSPLLLEDDLLPHPQRRRAPPTLAKSLLQTLRARRHRRPGPDCRRIRNHRRGHRGRAALRLADGATPRHQRHPPPGYLTGHPAGVSVRRKDGVRLFQAVWRNPCNDRAKRRSLWLLSFVNGFLNPPVSRVLAITYSL